MTVTLRLKRTGASEEQLANVESKIGSRLPSDYRKFLLENNGATPTANIFEIPQDSNDSGVTEFFGTKQICDSLGQSKISAGMAPIAHAEGGNIICLDLAKGSVSFFDHETESVFLVAETFAAFLQDLKSPDASDLPDMKVISAWTFGIVYAEG